MKNKKYHTVRTVSKSNRKIVERRIIYNPNTQIYNCLLSWLVTSTSIKSGGVRPILCAQISPLGEVYNWSLFENE
jgi:Cu/Ag efflux pump CusA